VIKLHNFLKNNLKNYNWKIIISNNASLDKTKEIAEKLSKKNKRIQVMHMDDRAKSRALKKVWLSEEADIYMYMDADLSTDISHIPELLFWIEKEYDIVTGSRTSKKSKTSREFNRNLLSLILILMIRIIFSMKLSDFQCGFKAINKKTRDKILPKMRALDYGFMDTELLAVAHNKKYKIKEIPVKWEDERETKIRVFGGIIDALKNMFKIRHDILKKKYD